MFGQQQQEGRFSQGAPVWHDIFAQVTGVLESEIRSTLLLLNDVNSYQVQKDNSNPDVVMSSPRGQPHFQQPQLKMSTSHQHMVVKVKSKINPP